MTIEPVGQINRRIIQQAGKTFETTEECFGDEFPVLVHYNIYEGRKGSKDSLGVPLEPDESSSIEIIVVYLIINDDLVEVEPSDDWLDAMRDEILETQ